MKTALCLLFIVASASADQLAHYLSGNNTHLNWAYFEHPEASSVPCNWMHGLDYTSQGATGRIVNSLQFASIPITFLDDEYRLTYSLAGSTQDHMSDTALFTSFAMSASDGYAIELETMSFTLGYAFPDSPSVAGNLFYEVFVKTGDQTAWTSLTGDSLYIHAGSYADHYEFAPITIDLTEFAILQESYGNLEFGLNIYGEDQLDSMYATVGHWQVNGTIVEPTAIPEPAVAVLGLAGLGWLVFRRRRQ